MSAPYQGVKKLDPEVQACWRLHLPLVDQHWMLHSALGQACLQAACLAAHALAVLQQLRCGWLHALCSAPAALLWTVSELISCLPDHPPPHGPILAVQRQRFQPCRQQRPRKSVTAVIWPANHAVQSLGA